MSRQSDFSRRNGFNESYDVPITIRNEAPYELRGVIIELAFEQGIKHDVLREIVCRQLKKRPDQNNWSAPNVNREIHDLVDSCIWYEVYDILEKICQYIANRGVHKIDCDFEEDINDVFQAQGIGWKLVEGKVTFRGDEGLDSILADAVSTLNNQNHRTAANELHEAIRDMSRRPHADVTGAIQHSIASLECVARELSGSKETLGRWLQAHPEALPKPLGTYIEKIWGFASEHGRHLVESGEPSMAEAELVLGMSATLGSYLSKKGRSHTDFDN